MKMQREDNIIGKMKDRFNNLCQTINGKLLFHLMENVNEKRSKKKASKKKNAEMNVDHFHRKKVIDDKVLMKEFCKLCVEFEPLTMEQKKKVFFEVANTTLNDKLRTFRAQTTARGSLGNEDNLTLRQQMDATAAGNKKKIYTHDSY